MGSYASVVYILSLMILYQVLKLVGFTIKKEAGKDAENVGRAWGELRSFENRGARAPRAPKRGVKEFQNFEFWKMKRFSKLLSSPQALPTFSASFPASFFMVNPTSFNTLFSIIKLNIYTTLAWLPMAVLLLLTIMLCGWLQTEMSAVSRFCYCVMNTCFHSMQGISGTSDRLLACPEGWWLITTYRSNEQKDAIRCLR